jgi:uncharacterized protein YjiS (DUF1127 family)
MNRHAPIPLGSSKRRAFVRALGGLLRWVVGIARALEHRREVRSLAELDERMLKDIGLSRAEVDGALAEPLHRDPSLVLVRSAERRSRIRAGIPDTRRGRPRVPLVTEARSA